jgi:hypothetical protein
MLAALVVRASKGVEGRKVHSEQSAQPQTLKEKTREGHQRSGVSSIGRGTCILVAHFHREGHLRSTLGPLL